MAMSTVGKGKGVVNFAFSFITHGTFFLESNLAIYSKNLNSAHIFLHSNITSKNF